MQKGRQGRVRTPPRKSQVAICFLRNTGTDPLEKQLDPFDPRSPIAFRERFVVPELNTLMTKKTVRNP